jgi:hypothetical protein
MLIFLDKAKTTTDISIGNIEQVEHGNCLFTKMIILIFNFLCSRGCQSYWWRKPDYPEKTIDLPQVTDKLYHIIFFSGTPRHELVRTHNLSSDCTGSCKFNYYAITTTTAPFIMVITK